MADTGSPYNLPYPASSDSPNGPTQIQALAVATHAGLAGIAADVAALLPAVSSSTQVTSGTTTATSFSATLTGGTACGVSFVAPSSGVVTVINTVQLVHNASGSAVCSYVLRSGGSIGSGTSIQSASDDNAAIVVGSNTMRFSVVDFVTGLTPGSTYNIQQVFRVTTSTGTFARKTLTAVPQFL